ncbi:MAG: signal peptide peptidase SppA [Bacteroidales bacterium]|nr:signal peptide peptidase SppA [Bacteroidales bacterium]
MSNKPIAATGKKKKFPFGKIMLASGLGTLIVFIIVGLFKFGAFAAMLGLLAAAGTEEGSTVTPLRHDTFLKIDLTEVLPERSPSKLTSLMNNGNEMGFADLGRAIRAAADNDKVQGLYLYMGSSYGYSWGMSTELRQMLAEFRESGKPIYVYADAYSQKGYFVASVADSIYMHPAGIMEFVGIGAEAMYYKELIDKLGVNVTLLRPKSNSYKSAGETYTTNKMSDANREQVRAYIYSLWDYATQEMAASRNISVDGLNDIADHLSAFLPNGALEHGLVDRLCFEADVKKVIMDKYGIEKMVNIKDFSYSAPKVKDNGNQIAVIYAQGDVVQGTGFNQAVWSDKITKALDEAAADDKIKAIVLRVNSPGGAVTASEIMTNAVVRAKEHKPIVVSMSDVAASAGYEISCNADIIVAQPTTVTGSIGVFGVVPEIGNTIRRYLGITTDTVKTNANSTSLSIMRPMSAEMMETMQQNIEDFYVTFVTRVANGRGLDYDFVDSIARGRVWTGAEALKLGLVDTLGGLDLAIRLAADLAEVESYKVIDYPAHKSAFEELTELSSNSGTASYSTRYTTSANAPAANGRMPEGFSQLSPQQQAAIGAILLPRRQGDGVWSRANAIEDIVMRLCEQREMQARVEFLLVED